MPYTDDTAGVVYLLHADKPDGITDHLLGIACGLSGQECNPCIAHHIV